MFKDVVQLLDDQQILATSFRCPWCFRSVLGDSLRPFIVMGVGWFGRLLYYVGHDIHNECLLGMPFLDPAGIGL